MGNAYRCCKTHTRDINGNAVFAITGLWHIPIQKTVGEILTGVYPALCPRWLLSERNKNGMVLSLRASPIGGKRVNDNPRLSVVFKGLDIDAE